MRQDRACGGQRSRIESNLWRHCSAHAVQGFLASWGNTCKAVPTAVIAWDIERVFPLEGKRNLGIMGRAFDLLPGGTMFSAACIQRGIVGVTVKMISSTKAEIINFEPVIMARADTDPRDLEEWQEELLEGFHAQPA
jgi:hypothetical protein